MLTCTFPASPIRCASYGALGSCEGRSAGLPARPARTSAAAARRLGRARAQARSLARDRREVGEHAQRRDDLVRQPVDLLAPGDGEQPFRRAARCGASGSPSASSRLCGTPGPVRQRLQPGRQRARPCRRAIRTPSDMRSTARSAPATASADRQMTSRGSSPPGPPASARAASATAASAASAGVAVGSSRERIPRPIGGSSPCDRGAASCIACEQPRSGSIVHGSPARTPEGRDILATYESNARS